jgi:multiple sugar transport system permease protein
MAGGTIESEETGQSLIPWRRLPVNDEAIQGFATVLPVILLYLIISIIPVGFAFYASFHAIPLLNPQWEFVGIDNYLRVFEIDRFWASLWRGIVYMVGSTLFQLVVGLWMALALNRITKGQKFLTAIVFTAYLIPTVIVSLLALFMFDQSFGVLHMVGAEWLGLWDVKTYALGAQSWAMPLVILIGSWKFAVFITIFSLAQLRSIPSRFYEAATIAGANKWQMFVDITFPRIKGIILTVVLLRGVFMFNKFDIFWMLTQGGPGYATTTLPVLAYRETFVGGNYGLGNAMAIVMFLFLAIGATLYFKAFNPSDEVET